MAQAASENNPNGRHQDQAQQRGREAIAASAEAAEENVDKAARAFRAFWQEAAGNAQQPLAQQVARANLEVIGFATRRARAYAEFPAKVVSCESPQELWSEQLRFFKDMLADYEDMTDKIFNTRALQAMQAEQRRPAARPG